MKQGRISEWKKWTGNRKGLGIVRVTFAGRLGKSLLLLDGIFVNSIFWLARDKGWWALFRHTVPTPTQPAATLVTLISMRVIYANIVGKEDWCVECVQGYRPIPLFFLFPLLSSSRPFLVRPFLVLRSFPNSLCFSPSFSGAIPFFLVPFLASSSFPFHSSWSERALHDESPLFRQPCTIVLPRDLSYVIPCIITRVKLAPAPFQPHYRFRTWFFSERTYESCVSIPK